MDKDSIFPFLEGRQHQTPKESEERYKAVLENISMAIISTDLDGKINTWNQGAEDIYGWGVQEALGKDIEMLFRREDQPFLARYRETLMTVGRYRGEGLGVKKDGKPFPLGFSITLVRDGQGQPRGYMSVMVDITERNRREKEKEILGNINKAIASRVGIREIYEIVGQELKKLIDFDTIDIILLEKKDLSPLSEMPHSNLLKKVVITARPAIERLSTTDSTGQTPSRLGLPLEYKGEIIGVLILGSHKAENFSTEQFEFLWHITSQLSLAIVDTKIHKDLRLQLKGLRQLNLISLELIREIDPRVLLEKIAADATRLIKGSSSQVCILEQSASGGSAQPEIASCHGIGRDILENLHAQKVCPCYSVIMKGHTLFVPDTQKDPQWKPLQEANFKTVLGVPVPRKDGRLIGAVILYLPEPYAVRDFETRLVEMYATQVSAALENAYLYKEVIQSEERYKELYDGAPCMYFSLTADGTILQCNKACVDILAYQKEELIGRPIYDLLSPETRQLVLEKLKRCVAEGHTEAEMQFVKKDGTAIDISLKATCLYPPKAGEAREIRAVLTNITEEKKLQERLLQIEKLTALGEMASGVAHEFNNTLAIILGNVQLLQKNYGDAEELKEGLAIIRQAAMDATETIRRVREFTRTKGEPSRLLPTDITALIREVIHFSRPRWMVAAQAKGVSYQVDIGGLGQVPAISANPAELREVFINILNNAMDAMPCGGVISFKTWAEADSVFVSVSDSGLGMTREVQKRIFDPFFTTKGAEGSGLGMSLVYGIIARHRGEIDVFSLPGKGTTVTLRLPISHETAQGLPLLRPEQAVAPTGSKILVVDDEQEICTFLSKALSLEGYDVKGVTSGQEALRLVKEDTFDIVLCDLVMPGTSGWEVIEALKGLEHRPRIGVITGLGDAIETVEDKGYMVDFLVSKPVDIQRLCKLIQGGYK